MNRTKELWQTLKVGDRVRVIELPKEFFEWPRLLPETKRAYRYLVARKAPLTVWMVDEYGFPWVKFQFRSRRGRMEYHSMALNHSGLAVVSRRRAGSA